MASAATTTATAAGAATLKESTRTTVKQLAAAVRSGALRQVVFLTGAGVSVAAGIPDFRSPGGMYDTLRPQLLTATPEDRERMESDPTFVVNRTLFQRNQFPYFEVRRPFILGTADAKWRPTNCHLLMRLFHDAGILRRIYTQNIDGLDHRMDIPEDKIINVHGTMCKVKCELCGVDGPEGGSILWLAAQTRTHIKDIYNPENPDAPRESKNILCPECNQPGLKPATVMYGGAMPPAFHEGLDADFSGGFVVTKKKDDDPAAAARQPVDLLIVMGTSLTVMPAAAIPDFAPKGCRKVLINLEACGPFAGRLPPTTADDPLPVESVALGACEDVALALIEELGWVERAAALDNLLCDKSKTLIRHLAL